MGRLKMPEGFCSWFSGEKDELRKYVDERSTEPIFFCNGGTQTIIVHFIQCVKLDDIKREPVWNPGRLDAIREWATADRLHRVKLNKANVAKVRDLPCISRSGHFSEIQDKEYEITDGTHRIQIARDLKLDCILADVEEAVEIHRCDTHLFHDRG